MSEIARTADHALRVLLEVAENGPATQAQIGRSLGLNRTVVHRLLTTLQQRGFVARQDNGYVPGAALVQIASKMRPDLRARARGPMAALAEKVGETVLLDVVSGEQAVALECVIPDGHLVRVEPRIGTSYSLSRSASGRAILANLPDRGLAARVLEQSENPQVLQRQLDSVRQLGYAVSHDELQQGVHGIAAPVFDGGDTAVGALAVVAPTSRANRLPEFTEDLLKAARLIAAPVGE
ncbi:IclR family transcriptional regulator [Mycolicibacterium litorale]|uniref:IclR family transcriptional regulator n=1 Tax=Mycolicibacterium litorale TaxID=758802 RepID=UPI003CE95DE1